MEKIKLNTYDMTNRNIHYWIYPGLSYKIYDANSAMKAVEELFDVKRQERK